jgi:hypothetical protein
MRENEVEVEEGTEVTEREGKKGRGARSSDQEEEEDISYSSWDSRDVEMEAEKGQEGNMDSMVTCPLFKIPNTTCIWTGTLGNLEKHVMYTHASIIRRSCIFYCRSFKNTALLIFFNSEMFLYYKHISYTGIMYAVVQQVGFTNKNYRYSIKLLAGDEEDIIFNFGMHKISEALEVVLDARNCFALTGDRLEPFIRNYEINMVVSIYEVPTHIQKE